jgi:hypothetical protein
MNKKILGIAVVLMAVAMLAPPVLAEPTKGRKTAVSLRFIFPHVQVNTIDEWYSGPVYHRLWESIDWNVELTINPDGPNPTTLPGTCYALRKVVQVMPNGKDTGKSIVKDYYEFTFGDGGFEGHALVMLDGFNPANTPPWSDVHLVGLVFQGTGAFEGQTLNVRRVRGTPPGITGYWLNYEP